MKFLLTVYLPGVLAGIASLAFLIYNGDWQWLFSTLIFWILLSGLGIAVGFHRIYSHRCYTNLAPWLDRLLLICGTLAGQGSSLTWVSVHRGYHHPFTDTYRDPHTPVHEGFWYAVMLWYLKVNDKTINHRYAVNLFRRPFHVFMHKHYTKVLYGFVIGLAVISWLIWGHFKLVAYGYLIALMISILQDNLVNYFGHAPRWGYRNFPNDIDPTQSSNFWLLGYLGFGQGFHQNHHVYPERFDFGVKWWEFDPCRLFKPLLNLGGIERK
jgi:stearoyl-CoA desaturase (delta-9 desaturase)